MHRRRTTGTQSPDGLLQSIGPEAARFSSMGSPAGLLHAASIRSLVGQPLLKPRSATDSGSGSGIIRHAHSATG